MDHAACADCGADLGLISFLEPLYCDECCNAPVRRVISPPLQQAEPLETQPLTGDLLSSMQALLSSVHAGIHHDIDALRAHVASLDAGHARLAQLVDEQKREMAPLKVGPAHE